MVKKCWARAVRASLCPVSYAGPQSESWRDSGGASSWCGGSLLFYSLAQSTHESSLRGLSVHVYSAQYRLFFYPPPRPWYRLALSPSHAPSVRLITLSPPCLSWLTEIECTHGWNHLFFPLFLGPVRMISSVPPAVSSWLNQTAASAGDSSRQGLSVHHTHTHTHTHTWWTAADTVSAFIYRTIMTLWCILLDKMVTQVQLRMVFLKRNSGCNSQPRMKQTFNLIYFTVGYFPKFSLVVGCMYVALWFCSIVRQTPLAAFWARQLGWQDREVTAICNESRVTKVICMCYIHNNNKDKRSVFPTEVTHTN